MRLPGVFGEHMELQREKPVSGWCWAEPGEKAAAALAGGKAETRADAGGRWKVILSASLKEGLSRNRGR